MMIEIFKIIVAFMDTLLAIGVLVASSKDNELKKSSEIFVFLMCLTMIAIGM